MKNSIARRIIAVVAGTLILFLVSTIFVVSRINNSLAMDNAVNYLGVFETQLHEMTEMNNGDYTKEELYKALVIYSETANDIRVTVINADTDIGKVLADTSSESITQNHADRPEVIEALKGKLGKDTRKSETFGVKSLYVAKLVTAGDDTVVLRVSVPVSAINDYLKDALIIMVVIFVVVLIIVFFISKKLAGAVIIPIQLIKNKLDTVVNDGANNPMSLTKYDEINLVLEEIDSISGHLSRNLNNYQREKDKLDFIIENIDLGVLALDADQNIIASNKKAQEYFDFEYKQPVSIKKITRDKIILDNIDSAVNNNEGIIFDFSYKNGKILETKLFPIASNDIKLIIILSDVTEVRSLSRQKQEFFINASHELNTPLSSILGYSEMQLLSDKLNKPFIETINQEAMRMKLLISDMLKISELEENREIIDERVDIKKIAEQVIISQTPKAEKKGISIISNLESCLLYANYEKITEVVSNLVDNAIKYTAEGGKVEISLKKQDGKAQFKVKDNGAGIAAKDLSRIFERFYRTNKGRCRAEGGTGLGLAIVKHICNHYNAPISVTSKENVGTEFIIVFALI